MKTKIIQSILKDFKDNITDYRVHEYKIKYNLAEILFLTLIAIIKQNYTYQEIHYYIKNIKKFNKKVAKLVNTEIPSYSHFHSMLINTKHDEIEKIFRKYFLQFADLSNLALDGKFLKGSDVHGQFINKSNQNIVNILDKTNKICIGHSFVNNKKNEIPAVQELLKEDFMKNGNQLFSFDALHTQVETLNAIHSDNNFFIAKVKGNQRNLKAKVIEYIDNNKPNETFSTNGKNIENNKNVNRKIDIFYSNSCNLVMFDKDFPYIQTIILITKTIYDPKIKKETIKTDIMIANFKSSATDFLNKIKSHWLIETFHYYKDTIFNEDDHIAYYKPFIMTIFRSFATNLYQLYASKNNMKMCEVQRFGSRKFCG